LRSVPPVPSPRRDRARDSRPADGVRARTPAGGPAWGARRSATSEGANRGQVTGSAPGWPMRVAGAGFRFSRNLRRAGRPPFAVRRPPPGGSTPKMSSLFFAQTNQMSGRHGRDVNARAGANPDSDRQPRARHVAFPRLRGAPSLPRFSRRAAGPSTSPYRLPNSSRILAALPPMSPLGSSLLLSWS